MNIVIPLIVTTILAIFAQELIHLRTKQKCGIVTLVIWLGLFWSSLLFQADIQAFIEANPKSIFWIGVALISLPWFMVGITLLKRTN